MSLVTLRRKQIEEVKRKQYRDVASIIGICCDNRYNFEAAVNRVIEICEAAEAEIARIKRIEK